jgi:hypothetical protein
VTPTNNEIAGSLFSTLAGAPLSHPIAWPGRNFAPPETGYWLEVLFMPNQGIDNGLAPTDATVPQGIFQVNVFARPGAGIIGINTLAGQIKALYPKNATIAGLVRVQRHPYSVEINSEPDRLMIMVTVPYTG